jgi:hypothetical protein
MEREQHEWKEISMDGKKTADKFNYSDISGTIIETEENGLL